MKDTARRPIMLGMGLATLLLAAALLPTPTPTAAAAAPYGAAEPPTALPAPPACAAFPQRYARALIGGNPKLTTPEANPAVSRCEYADAKRRTAAALTSVALDDATTGPPTPADAFDAQIQELEQPTRPRSPYELAVLVNGVGEQAWANASVAGPQHSLVSIRWRDDTHIHHLVATPHRTRWRKDANGTIHPDLKRLIRRITHIARKTAATQATTTVVDRAFRPLDSRV